MAEASEELENKEGNVHLEFSEETISTLILTSHWHADTYGMTSLTKCLINDLRLTDPTGAKINLSRALLEEENKIDQNDINDAAKHYVRLRGAKRPKGDDKNEEPSIKWLDKYSVTYYSHILREMYYDFLIGHMPYLANGICNLKEFCNDWGQFPKVILFVHALPKTSDGEVDNNILMNWLDAADIIFLVGHAVKAEIEFYVDNSDPRVHGLYIPNVPTDLFAIEQKHRKCEGKQVITLMTNGKKNMEVTGLNYELEMVAAVKAADSIILLDGYDYRKQIRMEFLLIGVHPDERDSWKEVFERIKKAQPEKKKDITFRFGVVNKTKDLQDFMKQTSVLLFPLKSGSPLFGIEALAAAAAGTPFFVSSKSGIASLLHEIEETSPVVLDLGDLESDSSSWGDRIFRMFKDPEWVKSQSENIKLRLIQDTTIASSHLAFMRAVAEKACIQLTIDIHHDCNSVISEDSIKTGRKFGVHLQEEDKENIQLFVTVFLTRLLHQRDKIDLRLLDKELPDPVRDNWKSVLSFLEDKNRKMLDFRGGSLNFLLFCLTAESFVQLKDPQWKNDTEHALLALLNEIVQGAELTIMATNAHIIITHEAYLPTMKGTSSQLLDWQSDSGYDTKSLTSSNPFTQVTEVSGEEKVRNWEPVTLDTEEFKLEHRCHLTYLTASEKSRAAFAVADCGKIAISYVEIGSKKGNLSVFEQHVAYSHTLSKFSADSLFCHPIIIKQDGKEFVAACTGLRDTIIHTWDLEKFRSATVYQSWFTGQQHLCAVDETTLACVAMIPFPDGTHRCCTVDISVTPWELKTILFLPVESLSVTDVSYLKTTDGTSCLLLSTLGEVSVWAVDMLTGRIKWKASWDNGYPVSICNDVDKNIYVADYRADQVFLLSEDDGTIIGSVNLRKYEIFAPHCIRVHDKFVYLAHKNLKEINKIQVSKVSIGKKIAHK